MPWWGYAHTGGREEKEFDGIEGFLLVLSTLFTRLHSRKHSSDTLFTCHRLGFGRFRDPKNENAEVVPLGVYGFDKNTNTLSQFPPIAKWDEN